MSADPFESSLEAQAQDGAVVAGGILNGANSDAGSEDEDAVTSSRRKAADGEAEAEAEGDEDEEQAGDDLFGDDDNELPTEEPDLSLKRHLDDAELDSGDDEGRADRLQEDDTQQFVEKEIVAMDVEVSRQAVPEPSDGEMYLVKVPPFMSIEPQAWQTTTFQPPTTEHHSKAAPTAAFSAYNTALTTIRWRHSPSYPSELQSNARINRWSDGSLTLQLASDPNTQYEVDGNPLAPPQRNPLAPTPISVKSRGGKVGRQGTADGEKYDFSRDAWTYLIVPAQEAEALRVTHKVTAGLQIRQTESGEDDAIEKLQAALATAANATKVGGATGTLEATEVDPELQRKQAEVAERQAMRNRKKVQNAQERERERSERTLGRSGLSSGRYGGLNVGMLEDEDMESGRGRARAGKARPKPRRRRNSEYSEDEDNGRKRFTKEDSYDQEDDFVAPSDEEEEVEDEDDPDDGIVEQARERTPKRDRARPGLTTENSGAADEDADAEGEIDDDIPQPRLKKRRIVDDDDED